MDKGDTAPEAAAPSAYVSVLLLEVGRSFDAICAEVDHEKGSGNTLDLACLASLVIGFFRCIGPANLLISKPDSSTLPSQQPIARFTPHFTCRRGSTDHTSGQNSWTQKKEKATLQKLVQPSRPSGEAHCINMRICTCTNRICLYKTRTAQLIGMREASSASSS